MDVREKLVELLAEFYGVDPMYHGVDANALADHLIAHGVAVQEWISVNERLPEEYTSILGYMTDAGKFPPVRECYRAGSAFVFPALKEIQPISHWCEMPEPPKGE